MILYDYILSASCYKVRLMASLTDVSLTLKAVNFYPQREHKSTAMLALNPAGTLPVLVDGSQVMTESSQILKHLAAQADKPWPENNDVPEWLVFANKLNESLGMARLHDILSYDTNITDARRHGKNLLRKLEERLTEQRYCGINYLTGPQPTIADIACFPNTALAPDGGVPLDPYPSIRLWMRAIRSLPGFIEMPGIHRLHELATNPEAAI